MPKRDVYHYEIRRAIEKDGWTVTNDPMQITWEEKDYSPDLGAERIIAAQRGTEKIAVEIKSFLSKNMFNAFWF